MKYVKILSQRPRNKYFFVWPKKSDSCKIKALKRSDTDRVRWRRFRVFCKHFERNYLTKQIGIKMNSLDMETPTKCVAIDSKILGQNGKLNQL